MSAKWLSRVGLLVTVGGISVLNAGCWEIALGIALANQDEPAPTYDDPYADSGDAGADDTWTDGTSTGDVWSTGTIDLEAESLSGSLGAVRDFEGGIWMQSGYDYGDVAIIQVDARDLDANWAVMVKLDIEGGLDHEELVPGAVFTFGADDFGYGSTRVYASLLGCSGPADGSWRFDQDADQVTIEVQEGSSPDHRRIAYTGTWSDGSTVRGTVEYRWR